MADRLTNVLILCTGNSARSILGEALVTRLGEGRFRGFSAGSKPKGQVHSMALQVLGDLGYQTDGFRSKSWDEFGEAGAPEMHLVITVCDNAAGEACPVWIGHPAVAHWGLDDPAAVEGAGQRAAFEKAYDALKARVERLVALPVHEMSDAEIRDRLKQIHIKETGA